MNVSKVMKKMIDYSQGNHHDINHFMKVHGFAQTIAKEENCTPQEQEIIEAAAIIHDIACPLCRVKYGNTNGKHQEEEGIILAKEFLADLDLAPEAKDRIVYLVGHHHTLTEIDGIDYQILIEADYLVNADESGYSCENIQNMHDQVFKTKTGKELLESIYLR
ncbi:HD domain-containing protein [Erysipelotrichaceae bacterium RD49]|nr:HD domain-containing protein [Erysipelotrichaceae bacterium RD49]